MEMQDKTRRLYRNLACCGGIPEQASESFREFTLAEYTNALAAPEFRAWFDSYVASFNTFFDGVLLGDLFDLRRVIQGMSPDDDGYSRVWAQYIKLIDRTAPVVDRMRKYANAHSDGPELGDRLTLVDETPQA